MKLVCLTLPVCPGCVAQKSELAKYIKKHPMQQVEVLDATVDEQARNLAAAIGVVSAPFLVVTRDGVPVHGLPGPLSVAQLESLMTQASGR